MNKKVVLLAMGILCLLILISEIYWLIIPFLLFVGTIHIVFQMRSSKHNRKLRWGANILELMLIIATIIMITVFILEIFLIPSSSMENTLFPGDLILVNKLDYGPKLPQSPFQIPGINLLLSFIYQDGESTEMNGWKYKRLKGYSEVTRNDVVVFRHPSSDHINMFMIKRCMALPGDTIIIERGKVKINKECLSETMHQKKIYTLNQNAPSKLFTLIDSLNIRVMNQIEYIKYQEPFLFQMSSIEKENLINKNDTNLIEINVNSNDQENWVYPKKKEFAWTIDDYGPLVLPYKGMTIQLNQKKFITYKRTIQRLENSNLQYKQGLFYLDDVPVNSYTFQHDYYFMMGDNRYFSNDSRYWGLVPEMNIVGKAKLVLFSNDQDGIKWERLLKKIN